MAAVASPLIKPHAKWSAVDPSNLSAVALTRAPCDMRWRANSTCSGVRSPTTVQ
jgi:hypothetical protein